MSAVFNDPSISTVEALTSLSNINPELSTKYSKISNLFALKHWHQLTQAILSFLSDNVVTLHPISSPEFEGITNTHEALYEKVVLKCDSKLNPQSLAQIASLVASGFSNADQACALLQTLLDTKKDKLLTSGTLYIRSKLVLWKLHHFQSLPRDSPESIKQKQEIESFLSEGAAMLKSMEDNHDQDSSVHSSYYEASKSYYKLVGPPDIFFREGMLFLNYTSLKTLSKEQLYELATDLSLAALTGEGVFHFGSVVNDTPILNYLEGTENAWLLGWMKCMANGDVNEFHRISAANASEVAKHGVLVSMADIVKEKIILLALIDLVFKKPSAERTLEFTEIASHVGVELERVEWVIMKALSLGLMKGSMDQVEGTVVITWVMPRVLDEGQLKDLAARFGKWAVTVAKERDYMTEQTIFV